MKRKKKKSKTQTLKSKLKHTISYFEPKFYTMKEKNGEGKREREWGGSGERNYEKMLSQPMHGTDEVRRLF